jgi:hypothetical protein
MWVVGLDWSSWTHIYTHCPSHFGANVLCTIMQAKLKFIFVCQ